MERVSQKEDSRKQPLSSANTNTSPESSPAAAPRSIPQKTLVSDHFLPQLRVAALHKGPSLQTDTTRGLGPRHPIIRDWNDRRAVKITSPSLASHQAKLVSSALLPGTSHKSQDSGDECVQSSQLVAAVLAGSNKKIKEINSDSSQLHHSQDTLKALHEESATKDAAAIRAVDYARQTGLKKLTVHFAEEDLRRKLSPVNFSTYTTVLHPNTASSKRASRHSHTLTFPPTDSVERKCLPFSSVSSFNSLIDSQRSNRSLTSLPSLPLIRNDSLKKPSLSSGSSSSFIQSRLSERDIFSSSRKERKEPHCSVINLRIPFGKVEEWDIPQRKIPFETSNPKTIGEHSTTTENISGTDNKAILRKIDFIVFSDLPKEQLYSTSSLVMESHNSSLVPPLITTHCPHQLPPASTKSSQTHTYIAGDTDGTVASSKFTDTRDSSCPTKGSVPSDSANSDRETNPHHIPEKSPSTFEISQFLPHCSLRYRHQRKSSLPARLVELTTVERDPNPSMSIRSYSGSPSLHRGSLREQEHVSENALAGRSNHVCSPGHSPGHSGSSLQRHRLSTIGRGRPGECKKKPVKRKTSDGFDYPDPLADCSSRYHHRLLKMAALVSQTLCYEHSRRRRKRQHSQ